MDAMRAVAIIGPMVPKRFRPNRTVRRTALRAMADFDSTPEQQILDVS